MKNNIGDKVTFTADKMTGTKLTGAITDVYELGANDFVYEVTTDAGIYHLNNDLKYTK